jgi:dimethylhistidine N-methyltransferase
LKFIDAETPDENRKSFAESVSKGFEKTPREVPPRFLYDERGSELFTDITHTDDYYVTDVERKILRNHSEDILEAVGSRVVLTEPGAGDCAKTRIILEAALSHQSNLTFEPIDISRAQLEKTSKQLLKEYEELNITAVSGPYEEGIQSLGRVEEPRLILFLGSSLGNLDHEGAVELLTEFSSFMESKDRLLIGIDLLKDRDVLEDAYDDSEGVTAEFNKNLLRRMNRELGGQFDLDSFEHQAPFVEDKNRIEMRLVSKQQQSVFIDALSQTYEFGQGDYIHTENSHKFTVDSFTDLAERANLTAQTVWTDQKEYFAEILLQKN